MTANNGNDLENRISPGVTASAISLISGTGCHEQNSCGIDCDFCGVAAGVMRMLAIPWIRIRFHMPCFY